MFLYVCQLEFDLGWSVGCCSVCFPVAAFVRFLLALLALGFESQKAFLCTKVQGILPTFFFSNMCLLSLYAWLYLLHWDFSCVQCEAGIWLYLCHVATCLWASSLYKTSLFAPMIWGAVIRDSGPKVIPGAGYVPARACRILESWKGRGVPRSSCYVWAVWTGWPSGLSAQRTLQRRSPGASPGWPCEQPSPARVSVQTRSCSCRASLSFSDVLCSDTVFFVSVWAPAT